MSRLVLLTGFLGAGKTTLMRSILDAFKGNKIGVIVNEFGQLSIDGMLIKRDGIIMDELSNGSIFCACIKDHFLTSLIEMSKRDLDYVFIEASGLADPANMGQILKAIAPKLQRPYDYLGAVCIIDAENFIELEDLLPALQHQVAYAGAIVLNKSDLADSATIVAVHNKLTEINGIAPIHITSYCSVNIRDMIDQLYPANTEDQESTNTLETRPKTFTLTSEQVLPAQALSDFLTEISEETYRVKGFANTDGGPLMISGVGRHLTILPWTEPLSLSEIVIISAVGIRLMSSITKALDKHLPSMMRL